jgi:succinylarginine dihydrolase
MTAQEANFDGLVGPTHHYAGLSDGNIASMSHRGAESNPRQAALEGLEKMRQMWEWGFAQAVLPPHERPHLPTLRALGYSGTDAEIIEAVPPALLSACSSASPMWVANAATVTPSADAADGRVHFTPANLASKFHRAIEAEHTAAVLARLFCDADHFAHHPPLLPVAALGDEGAANVMRLAEHAGAPGVECYVYGRTAFGDGPAPTKFVARQTRESFEAIARAHGVKQAVFLQQNPEAIDAGVFHNDVIAVAHETLLFFHEQAFVGGLEPVAFLKAVFPALQAECVPANRVSLEDAVRSYLFNSQIVGPPEARRLVAAQEVAENPRTSAYVAELVDQGVFSSVFYAPLRQSMRNGGGPACLRLRVVLTDQERAATHPGVWLDEQLYGQLKAWIERHYRDQLFSSDLADPAFLTEVREALDALTDILWLPGLYAFQRG